MTNTIPADDLKPGAWVTVRDHEQVAVRSIPGLDDDEAPSRPQGSGITSPGVPIRILETNLPFVYGAALSPEGEMVGPAIIDVRKVALVRLNRRVPNAIRRFARMGKLKAKKSAMEEKMAGIKAELARQEAESASGPGSNLGNNQVDPDQVQAIMSLLDQVRGMLEQGGADDEEQD